MACSWASSSAPPEAKRQKLGLIPEDETKEDFAETVEHGTSDSGLFEGSRGSWYLPSSETSHDALDSGFSDGTTPPASCDDSQEAFPLRSNSNDDLEAIELHLSTEDLLNINGVHPHNSSSSTSAIVEVDSGEDLLATLADMAAASSSSSSSTEVQAPTTTMTVAAEPTMDQTELLSLNTIPVPMSSGGDTTMTNTSNNGVNSSSNNEEEEEEDDEEEEDRLSSISGLSDLSESDWKSSDISGPFSWVQQQMMKGTDPRMLLQGMVAADTVIPQHLDQFTLWKIILNMLSEPPKRTKLPHINTIQNVVGLIQNCKNILVLTGAGVSVSCGIPDFRSRDGVYARLAIDFPDLPDPQAMFDIHYFRKDPRPFFKFAREIYPGQFKPSPCHRFIRCLEKHNKLLRNYTQNIDTLEQVVGIQKVVQCHGSFASATCTKCKYKMSAEAIKADIFDQKIPLCPVCKLNSPDIKFPWEVENPQSSSLPSLPSPTSSSSSSSSSSPPSAAAAAAAAAEKRENYPMPGIMKPDIVFFGEDLGSEFHNSVARDKEQVDLLIMIGSSLKVRPVALIPSSIPSSVPQILINRESLSHLTPDVELLGDCDGIINQLCHLLGEGWEEPRQGDRLSETRELLPNKSVNNTTTASETSSSTTTVSETSTPTTTNNIETKNSNETVAEEEEEAEEASGPRNVEPDNANDDDDEEEEENSPLWKPKQKTSLSDRLPGGQYYFQEPSRYIFPGAEVYDSDDDEEDEDEDEDESEEEDNAATASTSTTAQPPPADVIDQQKQEQQN